MHENRSGSLRGGFAATLALLLLVSLVVGCEGSHGWRSLPMEPGENSGPGAAPSIRYLQPDSGKTVAVGDSVLVEVQLQDPEQLASLELSGHTFVGSELYGTRERVERFKSKTVELSGRDTTIVRWLLPTADSLPADSVYLRAVVRDTDGNVSADSVPIAIGGASVQLLNPPQDSVVSAGTSVRTVVVAKNSPDQIHAVAVVLRQDGATLDSVSAPSQQLPADSVRVAVLVPVPDNITGVVTLMAVATSGGGQGSSQSSEVRLQVQPPSSDNQAPSVRFSVDVPARAETQDSLRVSVAANDNSQALARIGATVIARRTTTGDTLQILSRELTDVDRGTLHFALTELGMPVRLDSLFGVTLEVTAFAQDTSSAGNCATATVIGQSQSLGCVAVPELETAIVAESSGALVQVVGVRGRTVSTADSTAILVDLVVDEVRRRVLVSNLSRNRVEVLRFGDIIFGDPIAVGSRPWGLAIGNDPDTLFVANSGGTYISRVSLTSDSEVERIQTPDVRLYGVDYNVETDSASKVTEFDYSDRPQFLGQVSTGQVLYSTLPTRTRADGTVRIYDPAKDQTNEFNRRTEIFTAYTDDELGKAIVVNALDAGLSVANQLVVCPRRVEQDQSDPACISGTVEEVASSLATLQAQGRTDTRLEVGQDIESVGLSDTTFVAVSRDHSAIAFGEGSVDPGRILYFQEQDGGFVGFGEQTSDLVGNAAERVTALGLNQDGSLGVARGEQVYFFNDALRLQGVVESDSPSGGSALHPSDSGYPSGERSTQRAFVTGVEADGAPYVDVIDTYSFRRVRRIHLRTPITGSLAAVPVEEGEVTLRLFGIAAGGVVQIQLTDRDLQ